MTCEFCTAGSRLDMRELLLLVAVGLKAGAAIRKFPAPGDDDHPNEVQRGNEPGGGKHGQKVPAAQANAEDRHGDDDDLECGEAQGECSLRPAPDACALFVSYPGNNEEELQDNERNP